jgi:hypothetical protein
MNIVYLKKSNKKDKKFMVYVDGKTIHFGAAGMSDYTKHKDSDRMKRYENRHQKRENWKKSGIKTAGFWSKWLLWNKPSFEASKRDISRRFGVTFKSGWPNKTGLAKMSMGYRAKKSVKKSRVRSPTQNRVRSPTQNRVRSPTQNRVRSPTQNRVRSPTQNRVRSPTQTKIRVCAYISETGRCYKKKPSEKYERCVKAVKSRQSKKCSRSGYKSKGCYNPWAVCTSRVGRNAK